jgi:hypothetical protein
MLFVSEQTFQPWYYRCVPHHLGRNPLPTIIAGHETEPEQVDVKGIFGGVILLISTTTAWTTHKTIPLGCLSHLEKRMHAFNEISRASIGVHPCSAHQHYISTYQTQIKYTISISFSNFSLISKNKLTKL